MMLKQIGTHGSRYPATWMMRMFSAFAYFALAVLLLSYNTIWKKSFTRIVSPPIVEERNSTSSIVISDKNEVSMLMPKNPRIYLIHVGKAGGMSLINSLRLGRTLGSVKCMVNKTRHGEDDTSCYNHLPGDSQLTRHIMGYFHMWGAALPKEERSWLLNNTNIFLFTLRNPIDRLISTYNYHRELYDNVTKYPRYKKFHKDCFPDGLGAMVDVLQNGTDIVCTKLGVDTLSGRSSQSGAGGWHFLLNYQHYKKYTLDKWPNHTVAAIRTENMWDDVMQLDQMLGGTGAFGKVAGWKHTHGSEKYIVPYNDDISPSNTLFLCCLVYEEIETYQLMILKAVNLHDSQKRQVLSNLMKQCQIKTTGTEPLEEPFSWESFHQGETCIDSLVNINIKK